MDSVTRQCVVCDAEYVPVMPHQRYCSRACYGKRPQPYARFRAAYDRSAERRECLHCGTTFVYHPKLRTTYCSKPCVRAALSRRYAEASVVTAIGKSCAVPWRTCEECGIQFVARQPRKFCDRACARLSAIRVARENYRATYVPTPVRQYECVVCHTSFTRVGRHGVPKTCSKRCGDYRSNRSPAKGDASRRRRALMRGVGVVRYKRLDIYERDGWRCQLCGTAVQRDARAPHPKSPTIDHIIPLVAGGPDAPVNVQLAHFLCNSLKGAGDGQLRWVS